MRDGYHLPDFGDVAGLAVDPPHTYALLRPTSGPHASPLYGATAESLVFLHTAIQEPLGQQQARAAGFDVSKPNQLILTLENGFLRFLEVLRHSIASAAPESPLTVWYQFDSSRLFLYFIGDTERFDEIPEELLEPLLAHYRLFDYGRTPVPTGLDPLLGWIPPRTFRQYWNDALTLPDTAALALGGGSPVLPYGDVPSAAQEALIINGKPYVLQHGHFTCTDR
jgi:hypothetical protein